MEKEEEAKKRLGRENKRDSFSSLLANPDLGSRHTTVPGLKDERISYLGPN